MKLKSQLGLSEVFLVTEGLTGSAPSPKTTAFIYSDQISCSVVSDSATP